MYKVNSSICQTLNPIHLLVFSYGRADVGKTWKGKVYNPIASRLFYIVSGRAEIKLSDNQTILMEAGNWYLYPAGCSFEYLCNDHLDHIHFQLKLCGVDGIDLFRKCKAPISATLDDNKEDFFTEGLSYTALSNSLRVRQALYDILLSIMEKNNLDLTSKNLSHCVTRAIQYIKYNLSIQLSSERIAEHAFVSVSTLSKHFRKELGLSVHDYIQDMVLFEAQQLLMKSDMSIMEISEKYGFCDQFYFSRRFREKFGISPREYRKTMVL